MEEAHQEEEDSQEVVAEEEEVRWEEEDSLEEEVEVEVKIDFYRFVFYTLQETKKNFINFTHMREHSHSDKGTYRVNKEYRQNILHSKINHIDMTRDVQLGVDTYL